MRKSICHIRTPEQWRGKHVTIQTKINLYETFVISVLLYGAECWTVRKVDEQRILTAEMGWLRKLVRWDKQKTKEEKRKYQNRAKPDRNIGAENRKTQIIVVWAC